MDIRISSKQMLLILSIASWIIFAGVAIEAGAFIFEGIITFLVSPAGARIFWREVDLAALYQYDKGQFAVLISMMSIVAVLRATIFYGIIRILGNKTLALTQRFSSVVTRFINWTAWLALITGLFSNWSAGYAGWLRQKAIPIPDTSTLRLAGADVWLFMAVILFVVARIYKRGLEIQSENDLTV